MVSTELSLFSKLGAITVLELGRNAMVVGNPKGCQEIEGDLYVIILFDKPHVQIETPAVDNEVLATL